MMDHGLQTRKEKKGGIIEVDLLRKQMGKGLEVLVKLKLKIKCYRIYIRPRTEGTVLRPCLFEGSTLVFWLYPSPQSRKSTGPVGIHLEPVLFPS